MAKTVLLTGGAGFIGFHTGKRLLERGDTVVCIDNLNKYYSTKLKNDRLDQLKKYPKFKFHLADIADEKAVDNIVKKSGADVICHLAAQAGVRYSLENPLLYIDSNVRGTAVIFEAARKHKINDVVYASSSSVYGKTEESIFRETHPTHTPVSLYAATKKSNEVMAHAYNHLFGLNMTGLRFFTVYGPWGRPDMFAFLLCKSIIEDEPVKVFNKGLMHRDFTFIDDVVDGVVACLDTPQRYEVLNLGGANTTLLNDFIAVFEKEMGAQAKKIYEPMQPGDVLRTSADVTKATELLGWKPKFTLDQGAKEFCAWFKDYYKVLQKENVI